MSNTKCPKNTTGHKFMPSKSNTVKCEYCKQVEVYNDVTRSWEKK